MKFMLLLMVAFSSALNAQTSSAQSLETQTAQTQTQEPGSELRIYLMTLGPGDAVWERFGHNAIVVEDSRFNQGISYNWGMFDFDQPGYVPRLMKGRMIYWMAGYDVQAFANVYVQANRTIWMQELNLTPQQRLAMKEFVEWNALEANKFYRYDYYRDNCSTRVRDLIDYALGGALKRATATTLTKLTYRSESVRLVDDLKFTQLGINTALGEPADRRLTLWESMFIPMRMRDIIRQLRVPRADGTTVPLVADERTLYESRAYHERSSPRSLWLPYLLIGLLLAMEFGAVGRMQDRASSVRAIFRVEVIVWSIVVGLIGLVLLLAWTTTRHVFWFRNENLLLLNPLSLWLAVLVALSWRTTRFLRAAAIVAAAIAASSVVALACKLVPGTQDNIAEIALLLPPHLAIAASLWRSNTVAPASAAAV